MYGYQVGKLNVLKYANGSRSSPLYSLSGSQGNTWRIAQVTIASTVNHQVGFVNLFLYLASCMLPYKVFGHQFPSAGKGLNLIELS